MATFVQPFQAGGYPNEFFPGDTSGNNNHIQGFPAVAAGIGFGDPVKWMGNGVRPLSSVSDIVFGFATALRNREVTTTPGGITNRFEYAIGDQVPVISWGIVNLRCYTDVNVGTPFLFAIAGEIVAGDGSVGALTTSNSGMFANKVINIRGAASPLANGAAGGSVRCRVLTNLS